MEPSSQVVIHFHQTINTVLQTSPKYSGDFVLLLSNVQIDFIDERWMQVFWQMDSGSLFNEGTLFGSWISMQQVWGK